MKKSQTIHKLSSTIACYLKILPLHGPSQSHRTLASWRTDLSPTANSGDLLSDQRRKLERLWGDFFSDPSQWWDSRSEKENPRYPDFKHKKTKESLWLNAKLKPSWVDAQLDAMVPGTVQESVFTWNRSLARYVHSGHYEKTMELFQQMQLEGMDADKFTFVPVLNACSNLRALEEGRRIHKQIIESGFESDVFVGSCLVDMYARCGSIEDAERMFNEMPTRDVVSWTVMLGGYAMHGHARAALGHFEQMGQEGIEFDAVTFVSLLSACSHGGLVDEGLSYFESMGAAYNITVTVEHYACIIDVLGRAGRLHEAQDVIKTMSCEPNTYVWMCLLGACRVHGNVEMGECVARRVLELDPENAGAYVLLANIYAAARKWDSSVNIQI